MNKFTRSAVDRFNKIKEKEYLINPISEVDCEIFVELGQILKKAGLTAVLEIMKSYKELKDEEVRDQLLQFNIDYKGNGLNTLKNAVQEAVESVQDEFKYTPIIIIGDIQLKLNYIHGLQIGSRLDIGTGEYIWWIKINPVPDDVKSVPYFANHVIEFYDEENRNEVLNKLRAAFEENDTPLIDVN